ncbi:MAG TPA: outer membrane beta-barrel protein [Polyangiaceae bacterium]
MAVLADREGVTRFLRKLAAPGGRDREVTRCRRWFGAVLTAVGAVGALGGGSGGALASPASPTVVPWSGRVPPPPPLEVESSALTRAPERSRRPVEVVPEATLSLSSCSDGAGRERCEALGPGLGGGATALYRVSPYFGFGGGVSFVRSGGRISGVGGLRGEALGVGVVGRVYLLEAGDLDPYLELGLGWGSLRTTLDATGGSEVLDSVVGPTLRAGGGIDYVLGDHFRVGIAAGLSALVLGRGSHCDPGFCGRTTGMSGAMSGALVTSLRVTWQVGDPL